MDIDKRNRLVARLNSDPDLQLVPIDEFFDGNDDPGSIGCNLLEHPGVDAFRETFARLRDRHDVKAIYAQIAEVDPGEDCWPFSDTVLVVGDIPLDELDACLEHLQPDEVGPREHDPLSDSLSKLHGAPCLVAWWD